MGKITKSKLLRGKRKKITKGKLLRGTRKKISSKITKSKLLRGKRKKITNGKLLRGTRKKISNKITKRNSLKGKSLKPRTFKRKLLVGGMNQNDEIDWNIIIKDKNEIFLKYLEEESKNKKNKNVNEAWNNYTQFARWVNLREKFDLLKNNMSTTGGCTSNMYEVIFHAFMALPGF